MGNDWERRPVALGSLIERPEVATRVQHTAASWIGQNVVRPTWLWRRELVLFTGPGVVGVVSCLAVSAGRGAALPSLPALFSVSLPSWSAVVSWGWPGAAGAAGSYVLLGLVALVPAVRRWLGGWLRGGRLRRRWDSACRFAGVESVAVRVPRVKKIEQFGAGERLTIRVPKGLSADDLETAAEKIAVVLDVRDVRVMRDPDSARWPVVDVIRRNPFRDASGAPVLLSSPLAGASRWSLWDAVPVGQDDVGAPATVTLPGRNVLLGGEPEGGKSVAMGQFLAAGVLDPTVHLWGLDAKLVELALWEPVMEKVAYNSIDDATDLLDHLISEMDDRYAKLKSDRKRGLTRALGWPLHVLAIDELRFFTHHPEKKKRDVFNAALIDLVARGRAAGVIVIAATQRPSSDVVPTSLRDLFAYRWALRCSTRDASDTILGSGWATDGYKASSIDPVDRGLGLLLAEGGMPRLVKSAYLSDDAIGSIVARGLALREGG